MAKMALKSSSFAAGWFVPQLFPEIEDPAVLFQANWRIGEKFDQHTIFSRS